MIRKSILFPKILKKKWEIAPGKCTVNQLSVNDKQEIQLANQKFVSFADFQEGLALLAKNYNDLHNYSKKDLPNLSNNRTFQCLIDQIRGQVAATRPDIIQTIEPEKNAAKKEKKRRKRKIKTE